MEMYAGMDSLVQQPLLSTHGLERHPLAISLASGSSGTCGQVGHFAGGVHEAFLLWVSGSRLPFCDWAHFARATASASPTGTEKPARFRALAAASWRAQIRSWCSYRATPYHNSKPHPLQEWGGRSSGLFLGPKARSRSPTAIWVV